jgi:hypothetical protein
MGGSEAAAQGRVTMRILRPLDVNAEMDDVSSTGTNGGNQGWGALAPTRQCSMLFSQEHAEEAENQEPCCAVGHQQLEVPFAEFRYVLQKLAKAAKKLVFGLFPPSVSSVFSRRKEAFPFPFCFFCQDNSTVSFFAHFCEA